MVRINLKLVVGLTIPLLVVVGVGAASFFPTASNQGYMPEQPIPFSHKIHAGDNKIACLYCHSGAERSKHATVPAVNVCMNCHSVVKTDSPHIQKLRKHFEEGKPIEWVRIHEVPDFVYFPHKRHVTKGVSCETCHGDVKTMDKVYQAQPLTMGWCIQCHRGETTPKAVLAKFYPDMKKPQGHVATTNCSACHF
jgi:hypothetical protein